MNQTRGDKKIIKICYVLSYKDSDYIRTSTLVRALKKVSKVQLFVAKNTNSNFLRYVQTLYRFLKIRFTENPDIYFIGFRGHEIYWLLRIFALNKYFVFDEMMSPYDSLISEKKIFHRNSIVARTFFLIERSILRNSNVIITDTNLNAKRLTSLFGIKKEKIKVVYVGSNVYIPEKKHINLGNKKEKFTVLYYATFLPLHGIDVVLKTAKLLENYPIRFVIIGGRGKKRALEKFTSKIKRLRLKNIKHLEWLKFDDLFNYILLSDICLGGPFGGTPQARRVVTGKTYQFLSMGKPTIIGKINEDFGFIDGENCLLVDQNDPKKLSESILWSYKNVSKLNFLGEAGRSLFLDRFSNDHIRYKLEEIIGDYL